MKCLPKATFLVMQTSNRAIPIRYLRVMFTVDDLDETLVKLRTLKLTSGRWKLASLAIV